MIIKGNPGGNVGFWSKHLLRDDKNERVEVKEIKGLLAQDLPTALHEMRCVAAGSRSEGNFLYQANINPLAHENLTPEQWKEAIDTLEKNLGLEGHQRIVVEHVKEGRQHHHIIWNRVDVDTMRVADMTGNWPIHTKTARELENRFELTPTPTLEADRKPSLELWEIRAAERSGIDPQEMKAQLTELWRNADSGKAFASALDEHGYMLAKGDRRDFCVIDQAGDAHSLARRLDGVKAKDVRERMADVDRDSLPSVGEAREAQRERVRNEPAHEQPTRAEAIEQLRRADQADRATIHEAEAEIFWHDVEEKQAAKQERRDAAFDARQEAWRMEVKENAPEPGKGARGGGEGIHVVNAATGMATKLVDFVTDFLAATPADKTAENKQASGMRAFVTDPAARKEQQMAQIMMARQVQTADKALQNIRDDMEKGRGLSPADVANLTHGQQEMIRSRGDDALRQMVDDSRKRSSSLERERERD